VKFIGKEAFSQKFGVAEDVVSEKAWRILCIATGVGGLLFSRHYSGFGADFLHAHGANISFSFAAYFLLRFFNLPPKRNRFSAAAYAIAGVSAQEGAQAVGLYPGIFDGLDFLFNAAGISLALGLDILRSKQAD